MAERIRADTGHIDRRELPDLLCDADESRSAAHAADVASSGAKVDDQAFIDALDATASVTVCAFAIIPTDAPLLRIPGDADDTTGIHQPSRLMVDKTTTVPRSKLAANESAASPTTT